MATKEGTLKDLIGAKFDGVTVNDLTKFLNRFEMAIKLTESKPEKKHMLLISQLTGRAQEVGMKQYNKWVTDNPLEGLSRSEKEENAEEGFQDLVETLKTNPLITGVRPISRLLDKFYSLTQGEDEEVSVYHHRLITLVEKLEGQDPPETFTQLQLLNTFIGNTPATGLRPPLQRHVKLLGPTTKQEALKAAVNYESATRDDPDRLQTTHIRWAAGNKKGTDDGVVRSHGERDFVIVIWLDLQGHV